MHYKNRNLNILEILIDFVTLPFRNVLVIESFYKFKEDDIREIRRLGAAGYTYGEIAKIFNCTNEGASQIIRRVSWKHVN